MYADTGDSRSFYEAVHKVYRPFHQIQALLHSSDGSTPLIDKESIRDYFKEHIESLFSDQHLMDESSVDKMPQWEAKLELDSLLISEDIKKAIAKLKAQGTRNQWHAGRGLPAGWKEISSWTDLLTYLHYVWRRGWFQNTSLM